jgi:Fic family protein
MPSGHLVTQNPGQPTAYKAFIPAPLPPDPPLDLQNLWRDLSAADRALARLDGASSTLPNPDLFVSMYVKHEAVLSSQIEGTQSTLEDVLASEANEALPAGTDVDEVFNYIDAMDHGLRRLPEFPMSLPLICEIHKKLLQGVRGANKQPGEFRKSQNWVGGEDLKTAVYVPPPPAEMWEALNNLEKFLHRPDDLPVLIHCALVHSQFETIHPFLDGNGRMGRLLITFQLCWEKVLSRPLLYLSYYFKMHRAEYYDRLQAVRVDNDWEGWIRFFLRGVEQVSTGAENTAQKILELRERLRRAGNLTKTGRDLVHLLFSRPIISVKAAAVALDCTFATANGIMGQLEDQNVLQEVTGQRRNRKFRFRPYLDLFEAQAIQA